MGINGMASLIEYGMSGCDGGFGIDGAPECAHGSFGLVETGNVDDTLDELDLLLTGGRLTSKDIIKNIYQEAEVGSGFKQVQKAILMTPEFNTIGSPLYTEPRSATTPRAVSVPADYKAMVLLMMQGGCDSFNLIVPREGQLWSEYTQVRGLMALQDFQLNNITTSGQSISKFGVHFKLPFLKTLYDSNEAAFVTNLGPLVEPTAAASWKQAGSEKCKGLFSHSDQSNAAYTLKCQELGTGAKGAGGRMSDALLSKSMRSESFSVAGTSPWSEGFATLQQIIDQKEGSVRLENYESLNPILKRVTDRKHGNVYCEEYAQSVAKYVESSRALGTILDNTTLQSLAYGTEDTLAKQLHQVSRLISARTERKAERDFFYVSIGGFDTHSNADGVLAEKFESIDSALEDFVAEMKAQGIFDNVVVVSESEFGRSLTTNGHGTDHGWGGNHFILGGKINGGKIYNDYPASLLEGNSQDAGRGRMIPKYPWENIMVPIAEWMGVDSSQLSSVFPNLQNFDSSFILSESTLFSS